MSPLPHGGAATPDWITECINGGTFKRVDLNTGTNGWSSPPGDLFNLRSKHYLTRKTKTPAATDYLLKPAGMDWLKTPTTTKLTNILANHELTKTLKTLDTKTPFIIAVNLQIPGKKDHHNAVFYFATDDPIPPGSLLHRFITGSDEFRNSRFKLVNRIVKGPWIVKKAVGNYSACLLGKALTCSYHRGDCYLEIDVDIGSSGIASTILRLALGYVTSVTIDMGFLVEGQKDDELPEKLFGAIRVSQMEMSSAVEVSDGGMMIMNNVSHGLGCCSNKVGNDDDITDDDLIILLI